MNISNKLHQQTFVVLFIVTITLQCNIGNGQQGSSDEFDNGPLQEVSEAMQKLARLKIKDNKLVIRRDWKGSTEKENQNRIDAEAQKMIEKGFGAADAGQLAERMYRSRLMAEPVNAAFFAVADLAGRRSSGRSGGSKQQTMRFSGSSLSGYAEINDKQIRLTFDEQDPPSREIEVISGNDGSFRFKYSGDDFLVELKQASDGKIRIVRVRNEETKVFTGSDFFDLRGKNENMVDQWLIPLLVHVGFTVPMSSNSAAVQKVVIAKLVEFNSSESSMFERLLLDLDSDDFETRDKANDTLVTNRERWRSMIEAIVDSDGLSAEVNARLKNLLKLPADESPLEEIIRERKLLNSADYLIGLFDVAEESKFPAISKRLTEVTGKKFSTSDEWKKWLGSSRLSRSDSSNQD